jgi:beta-N-acetylglucosaminidase/glucan-binding YG repeat protein
LKKKRVTAIFLATMLFSSSAAGATAAGTNTWKYQNNHWYYVTPAGKPVTGWVQYKGNWYFLGSNGVMQTGWLLYNNRWYYLDKSSGAMKTGWLKDKNTWYYLQSDGAMKTGWLWDHNHWYFLEKSGAMATGWIVDQGKKYYLNSSGQMVTGQKYIEGKPYVFTASGALSTEKLTGWFRDGTIVMYFNPDGSMHTGWLKDQNQWYYFNSNGEMVTGWVLSNNKWYYMNSDGSMKTGFLVDRGSTYYLNDNGEMRIGWLTLGNNQYYFDTSGKMVTGKQVINGKTYNFSDNGILNTGPVITKTQYNLTLQQMTDLEMNLNPPPQTDLYSNHKAYVSSLYIQLDPTDKTKGVVTANGLNVREDPNTSAFIYGTLSKGQSVTIVSTVKTTAGTWYEIKYVTWRNAKPADVATYLDPNNFSQDSPGYLQFLLLNKNAGTSAADLNANILKGKGILNGMGDAFIKASLQNNVNEIYLIAHALLETGNGSSKLANGVQIDTVDGKKLDKPVTVYNMFGIGAFDTCPDSCGAQTAYKNGWFTPEKAIIGGAAFIGSSYINNPTTQQNTLYKMRWNPANPGYHQYATDISWAANQVYTMKKIYDSLSSYTLYYDIPVYKK